MREIWNGAAYRDFRKALTVGQAAGGLRELRLALEPVAMAATLAPEMIAGGVAVVIPALNEAESIGAVIGELPRDIVGRVIVVDSGSSDGTPDRARRAGAEVITIGRGYGRACLAGAQPPTPPTSSSSSTATAPTIRPRSAHGRGVALRRL